MSMLARDVRYSLRAIRRSPLFAAVAILSLALGIGANTAIFTLMDQLMLRKLPVRDPEQLVVVYQRGAHNGSNMGRWMHSYPIYEDFRQKAAPFAEVLCRRLTSAAISVDNQTERVDAEMVSGNFFTMLGVKPAIGRLFTSDEDDRIVKGHPVVALSYQYWVNRFNSDPAVIGKKVLINNYPMTIVGVSARGFAGLDPAQGPQIRIPVLMKEAVMPEWSWFNAANRRTRWVQVFARMKPGYTTESARASLQGLFHQIREYETTLPEAKDWNAYARARFLEGTVHIEKADTGYSELRNSFSTAMVVLMSMVGLVLLIACGNVANLLIARAFARQKEVAVRLSVGASRGQLVRQLLVESLVLSFAGGIAGVLLATAMTRALLALVPSEGSPLLIRPLPDARILLFTLAVTFFTGLVFGLLPALRASRPDVWSTLKGSIGGIAGSGGSVYLRKGLVAAQVALSLVLLFGAGLFVGSLKNLQRTDTGFRDPDNLVTFQLNPALNGYNEARGKQFFQDLLDHIRAVPGVRSAGIAAVPVLHGWEWDNSMGVEGHDAKDGENMQAFMNAVSPGYFGTMGVQLIEGRDFDRRDVDRAEKTKVAIVNRQFARHFFGDRSAVGHHLGNGVGPKTKYDIEIIGVVADSLYEGPREGVRRQVFIPHAGNSGSALYVRAGLGSSSAYAALRRTVKELDAAMPIYELKTVGSQLDETLLTERLTAMLSAGFGLLATLLAAVGLYGVMAFVVARRTKELGLRMALGAQSGSVVWLVMKEVLLLVGIGLAVGVPSALALGRFVATQLYGIKATDPWIAGGSTLLLTVVAALAGLIPARRASRIDPILALRYE